MLRKIILSKRSSIGWVIVRPPVNGRCTLASWGTEETRNEAWDKVTGLGHCKETKCRMQREGYKAVKVRMVPV